MDTLPPVSYTHLDVYKRQLLARGEPLSQFLFIRQRGHPRQHLAFEELQTRAAAGANVRHFSGQAALIAVSYTHLDVYKRQDPLKETGHQLRRLPRFLIVRRAQLQR